MLHIATGIVFGTPGQHHKPPTSSASSATAAEQQLAVTLDTCPSHLRGNGNIFPSSCSFPLFPVRSENAQNLVEILQKAGRSCFTCCSERSILKWPPLHLKHQPGTYAGHDTWRRRLHPQGRQKNNVQRKHRKLPSVPQASGTE